MDMKYKVTREALRILSHYSYPYVVFTRSDVIARDEYLKELRKDLCSIQFSISGNNEKLTRLIEPGAPSVKLRFDALKKINEAGFWTTVRINPFFPMKPDGFYSDPDSVQKRFGSLIGPCWTRSATQKFLAFWLASFECLHMGFVGLKR
jgi:DNA repair photolyase